jgi:hypothetical protein
MYNRGENQKGGAGMSKKALRKNRAKSASEMARTMDDLKTGYLNHLYISQ